MNKKFWILLLLLVGAVWVPTAVHAQVVVERSTEIVTISNKQYYMHHVKRGETLYSISRAYKVTEAEILKLNPEINDLGLQAEMVIGIPVVKEEEAKPETPKPETPAVTEQPVSDDDEYGDGYIIHTVKEAMKTKRFLRKWEVDEEEFRSLNPSVGSRVFVGQKVLIPMPDVKPQPNQNQNVPGDTITPVTPETIDEDTVPQNVPLSGVFVLPEEKPLECYASAENADRLYHVALLVPLYLNEIDKLDLSLPKIEKTKNARALKFLQFYEGFMMAVDSLTEHYGLRLELTVIDVNENVAGAHAAVEQLKDKSVDLIVGPFFSKSFAVVQDYASHHNIMIVNPLSERESILVGASNVVKLKPDNQAMVKNLADLIRLRYPKAKVTLLAEDRIGDSVMVVALEHALTEVVSAEVQFSNAELFDLIAKESSRRKMGKRMLSTMEIEGQIFSSKALGENPDGMVVFENPFQSLSFSDNALNEFKNGLSSARDNVLVAYGTDVVFATQILNNINKSAQKFPITLIGLPDWPEFDNLLVENLLNMNAIYFDDHFVNYNDSIVLDFVDDFRAKYESDPINYAFEGFDVGWYFLNALMQFGSHAMDCLPYYHIQLFNTRYYFNKNRYEDGLGNRYWNIYQYDNQSIELKPITVYPDDEE